VDFDDLDDLFKLIDLESDAYGKKLDLISARLKQSTATRVLSPSIEKGVKKLKGTSKVMSHKLGNLKEKVAKLGAQAEKRERPDLSGLKQALEVQLSVAKLANKQADFVLQELDKIAGKD
jgi:nitrate reductase alpha subunit